ncbi:phosphatidylglycerophosphatase A [Acetobacteraceae bacterium KSS8]|uniref:Phosphatidylglycerophosphatase A n=1 Tax=Endosaccharibacter trunci TaxID=2812733 RepID=A0ABT1W4J1_9PROT|nr:phosphatidylglycerophosphatase A [Acetobacteraceae bacterium KSS8]
MSRSGGWARIVASAGGSGFAPRAPGTVGTLVALPVGWALLHWPSGLLLAIVLVCPLGILATERAGGGEDHGWIVVDEVAGMWITLLGLLPLFRLPPLSGLALLVWCAIAFALFRLLDITKPGPIGRIDRRHDSIGVMGDDMLAGLVGAVLLLALRFAATWIR